MRDGIYKTLPLGRGWKSLLRSCEREKERGSTASARAKRAVALEFYSELSGQFVSALNLHAIRGKALFTGFNAINPEISPRELGGCNSPLEQKVLKSYVRREAEGISGRELVSAALREGIEELKQRRSRQIEQHCLQEAGAEAKPILEAARLAISEVEASSIVEDLLEGRNRKAPRVKQSQVELDEDLTKNG